MRVAIGVMLISLLGSSVEADAVNAADKVTAPAIASARGSATDNVVGVANPRQDASNFSRDAAGRVQLKNARTKAANDDRRLASLDPAQIVYSQPYLPAQGFAQMPLAQASLLDLNDSPLFPRQDLRAAALHHARTLEDFVLMGFVALMLIVYQLRKKHRFLRPHPFSY